MTPKRTHLTKLSLWQRLQQPDINEPLLHPFVVEKHLAGGGSPDALYADRIPMLQAAIQQEQSQSALMLIEAGACLYGKNDAESPVMLAVENHLYDVVQALHGAGADFAVCDAEGNTPIHVLFRKDYSLRAEQILNLMMTMDDISIDDQNICRQTALHAVLNNQNYSGKLVAVDTLLKAGARVDLDDENNQSAFDLAVSLVTRPDIMPGSAAHMENIGILTLITRQKHKHEQQNLQETRKLLYVTLGR